MCVYHKPVLLRESIAALAVHPSGVYVDATFGGGGHSRALLESLGPQGKLYGFDQDADSAANIPQDPRFCWIHANFRFIHNFCRFYHTGQADGILADLGVSWHQFDTDTRGFSFRFEGPLDMRMNESGTLTAATVLNTYAPESLENIFRTYGDLSNARALANAIIQARATQPLSTTTHLRQALQSYTPKVAEHKFLAKVYQALRMEVNSEVRALNGFLGQCLPLLKPGGRLAVITYHSIEDRLVKHFMRDAIQNGLMEAVTRKPLVPEEKEIQANTRARSAKLRVAVKTEGVRHE